MYDDAGKNGNGIAMLALSALVVILCITVFQLVKDDVFEFIYVYNLPVERNMIELKSEGYLADTYIQEGITEEQVSTLINNLKERNYKCETLSTIYWDEKNDGLKVNCDDNLNRYLIQSKGE